MGHIVAIVNNKGGVGKTTVTVNLADALGKRGKKVLVVDMDPQCNTTARLVKDFRRVAATVHELLDPAVPTPDVASLIYTTDIKHVAVIPNVDATANLEPALIGAAPDSFLRLRDGLRAFAVDRYDYTLIDNPPNMGTFVLSSLQAADFVLVPVRAGSTDSVDGLIKAMRVIKQVRGAGQNPALRFLRVLINGLDRRTGIGPAVADKIRTTFAADEVFETAVPVATAFERAESAYQTVFQFAPTGPGAAAFRALAAEMILIVEGGV